MSRTVSFVPSTTGKWWIYKSRVGGWVVDPPLRTGAAGRVVRVPDHESALALVRIGLDLGTTAYRGVVGQLVLTREDVWLL